MQMKKYFNNAPLNFMLLSMITLFINVSYACMHESSERAKKGIQAASRNVTICIKFIKMKHFIGWFAIKARKYMHSYQPLISMQYSCIHAIRIAIKERFKCKQALVFLTLCVIFFVSSEFFLKLIKSPLDSQTTVVLITTFFSLSPIVILLSSCEH
jgi:hypothetical protein